MSWLGTKITTPTSDSQSTLLSARKTLTLTRRPSPESLKEPLLSDSPTYASYEPPFPLHSYPHAHDNSSTPPSYTPRRSSSSESSFSSLYGYASQAQPLIAETNETAPAEQTEPQTEASQQVVTRPRSRSKPSKIFIHPADSNLARADAAALQLGIGGDTELVKGVQCPPTGETAWKTGKGRVLARQLMGSRSTLS